MTLSVSSPTLTLPFSPDELAPTPLPFSPEASAAALASESVPESDGIGAIKSIVAGCSASPAGSLSTKLNVRAATLLPVPLRVRMRWRRCVTSTPRFPGVSGAPPLARNVTPRDGDDFAPFDDLNALLGPPPPSLRTASGFRNTMLNRLG